MEGEENVKDNLDGCSLEVLKSMQREQDIRDDLARATAERRRNCLADWDRTGLIP